MFYLFTVGEPPLVSKDLRVSVYFGYHDWLCKVNDLLTTFKDSWSKHFSLGHLQSVSQKLLLLWTDSNINILEKKGKEE